MERWSWRDDRAKQAKRKCSVRRWIHIVFTGNHIKDDRRMERTLAFIATITSECWPFGRNAWEKSAVLVDSHRPSTATDGSRRPSGHTWTM